MNNEIKETPKNNKKAILGCSIGAAIVLVLALIFTQMNKRPELTPDLTSSITELTSIANEYYMDNWTKDKFISYNSNLTTYKGVQVTLDDILAKNSEYTLPKELKGTSVHFTKPNVLKPFLGNKINDTELEILTIFTAVPVKGGMFVSSLFDEGGILTKEQYKNFLAASSPIHGDIVDFKLETEESKNIIKAVEETDDMLINGNIKHLSYDNKYAVIVISSKDYPNYIKEFALENVEGKWKVVVRDLEQNDPIIYANYAYIDLNLDLLPNYDISAYYPLSSNLTNLVDQLVNGNKLDESEVLTYSCSAGKFYYLEFESGAKILGNVDSEGIFQIYQVDTPTTAINKIKELSPENAPIFIVNYPNLQ